MTINRTNNKTNIKVLISSDLREQVNTFDNNKDSEFFDCSSIEKNNLDVKIPLHSTTLDLIIISEATAQVLLSLNETIPDPSLKSKNSSHDVSTKIPIVLVYINPDSTKNFEFLVNIERINHLISIQSENLNKDLIELQKLLHQNSNLENKLKVNLDTSEVLEISEMTELTAECIFQTPQFSHLQDVQKFTLTATRQRHQVYEELTKYANTLESFCDFSDIVLTIASELIMNAFYDGKRNHASGTPDHGKRTNEFDLDPGETIKFMYGVENDYLWIIIQDPFGSADRNTIIKALHRAAKTRAAKLDSSGGAGLGLIMLYEWCSTIHFKLSEGRKTIVACKLKITKRNKIFSSEKNSLHIFLDK